MAHDTSNQDEQHLQLLTIFHYVVALMIAAFACFPVFHLVMGIFLLAAPETFEQEETMDQAERGMLTFVGLMFTVIPSLIILLGWTCAVCLAIAGRCLARRTNYTFCLAMAAIACLFMPFGTVLGVLTIIVLVRPSVKEMFDGKKCHS
jgi:hypothetical protein